MKGKHWIIIIITAFALVRIISYYLSAKEKDQAFSDWQFNDHKLLTQKCIDDSGEAGIKHPKLISSYCWCSTNEIQSNFTKKEYLRISNEQIEVQMEEILPVIQKCQAELKEKIEMKEVQNQSAKSPNS